MADPQKRAEAVDQMVAIVAADGDLGRTSCEELLRSTGWNVEVSRFEMCRTRCHSICADQLNLTARYRPTLFWWRCSDTSTASKSF